MCEWITEANSGNWPISQFVSATYQLCNLGQIA